MRRSPWVSYTTAEGRSYYFNAATNVTVWEKPGDFGEDDLATMARAATYTYSSAHQLDYDNIALMDDISEPPLLALLKRRLLADQIYTWTGDARGTPQPS